jgi:hypothetical protein
MMEDIDRPAVRDMAMAIIPQLSDGGGTEWVSYLINMKKVPIEGVLVSSRGYGKRGKEQVKTSELRHFLDVMEPRSFRKVELITEELLGLTNQYWVSFYEDGVMYDKKYLFMPGSIHPENMTSIPVINEKGILII